MAILINSQLNIALVEDDPFKLRLLEAELGRICGEATIRAAGSVQSAVALIGSMRFDLVILDIALPSHDSSPQGPAPLSMPSGGLEVLYELSYENRSEPVIIITQYPEIEIDHKLLSLDAAGEEFSRMLDVNIVGVVYFEEDAGEWGKDLRSILEGRT